VTPLHIAKATLGTVALLWSAAALAQAPPARPTADATWGLGLGLSTESKPYRGVHSKTRLLPLITFENRWVRVFGPGLEVKLPVQGPLSMDLRLRYQDTGYAASDSAFLAGMQERKNSLWAGARVAWRHEIAQLSVEWLGDASHHSGGQQLKLGLDKTLRLGPVLVQPRLALSWQDAAHVNHHFGVRPWEARAGRPAYAPGSDRQTELGVRLTLPLAPHQVVYLDLGHHRLGSQARNSPLVDRSGTTALRLGGIYRF
jgi:outer membrane protein